MIKKVIKIPIYFGELILIQTNDYDGIRRKYKLEDLKPFEAVTFPFPASNGYSRYYLVCRDNCTHKTIAHEVIHIVNMLFCDRDIPLDTINDEPQAYLAGWVTEQCYKYLKIE